VDGDEGEGNVGGVEVIARVKGGGGGVGEVGLEGELMMEGVERIGKGGAIWDRRLGVSIAVCGASLGVCYEVWAMSI